MAAQRVTFDLNRSGESGRGMIVPDGIYKLRVEEVEVRQGNAGPFVSMKLKIIEGGKGTLYSNLSTSEKSRWVVDQFLDAAGFPKKGQVGPEKFRGKEVWAELGNSSYEAEDKNTKKKVMRMKNEIKNWLTPADAAQLKDVYAQNAAKAEAVPNGKDPFKSSYVEAEAEEDLGTGDGEDGEDDDDDDDESVFAGMPSDDDDEFGTA